MRRKLTGLDLATALVLLAATALLLRPDSVLVSGVRTRIHQWSQDRTVSRSWDSLVAISMPLYDGGGPPDILEFSDYECPFCRAMSPSVDSVLAAGLKVSVVHLPLPIHKNAKLAARIALCAGTAKEFNMIHKSLFEKASRLYDSTAIDPSSAFSSLALDTNCVSSTPTVSQLEKHMALADQLKIDATPTFVTRRGVIRDRISVSTLLAHGRGDDR